MSENKKNQKPKVGERFDGERAVAEMLEKMSPDDRDRLLRNVSERDPALAERLREAAFSFEQLLGVESQGIQFLVSAVPRHRWLMALRKVSEELSAHIYASLPARTRDQFEEEMRELGPQRMSDVIAAQEQIAEIARKLLDDGKIALKSAE